MSNGTLDDLLPSPEQVLLIRPDEVLIFKFDQRLTQAHAADIYDHIAAHLPDLRFLIIGDGVEVNVVRQEDQ
jgi:hypothetical protein